MYTYFSNIAASSIVTLDVTC